MGISRMPQKAKHYARGVIIMTKPRLTYLLVLLTALLLTSVSVAFAQTIYIDSDIASPPYPKTNEWKEFNVYVKLDSSDYVDPSLWVYLPFDSVLTGEPDEVSLEVWDGSTWKQYDPEIGEYYYYFFLSSIPTSAAETTFTVKARIKFAEGKSAVYNGFGFELWDNDGNNWSFLDGLYVDLPVTDSFEPDNDPGQAHVVDLGSSFGCLSLLSGNYDSQDWFVFTINEPRTFVSIETSGCEGLQTLDTVIELYDSEFNLLASDDDSGNNYYSKIFYYFSSPGDYYVRVKGYEPGSYEGYYSLSVSTFTPSMEISGFVFPYSGGTLVGLVKVYDKDGNVAATVPVGTDGYYEVNVPAGDYKLYFSPHPDLGLVPEWYNNKRSFEEAYVITPEDCEFYNGTLYYVAETAYLASEDNVPTVEILSPVENEVVTSTAFSASFIYQEDSQRKVAAEIYNSNNELIDGYYNVFEPGTTQTVDFAVNEDGKYIFKVNVEDESGNIAMDEVNFYVDTQAPSISIEGIDGTYFTTTVTPLANFFDANLTSTEVVLYKDGEVVADWTNGTPVAEEGDYVIYAEASDIAENVTTASASFVIDRTAPSISFKGFENGGYYNTTVTPSAVFDDKHLDVTEVVLYKDGEEVSGWTNGDPVTEEGSYEVFAYAKDKCGNEATASASFVIDMTAPEVTILSPEPDKIYSGTFTVDATYSAEVTEIEVLLNDTLVATSVPVDVDSTEFDDGAYELKVVVKDRAGNAGMDSISITIDNNAPQIVITPEDGSYVSADEIVPEIDIYDACLKDVYCFLNGAPYSIGTTITGEGSYELIVVAADQLGRSRLARSRFVLDNTAPQITISGVEDNGYYNSPVTPVIEITDTNLATVTITLNGKAFESGTQIAEDGTYKLYVVASDKAGNTTTKDVTFSIALKEVLRIFGNDRIKTAVTLSEKTFTTADAVVIATAYNFPDALAAAPLAHALSAPILLVNKDTVPDAVISEIERLGAQEAYIVGGEGVISAAVEDQLKGLGLSVERIAGVDRYDTAVQIAYKLSDILGVTSFEKAYIATGENFPDALAAGGVAAKVSCPILLVKKDYIPYVVKQAIEELGITQTYILGGVGAVSSSVESNLPNPTRLAGKDRYETAVRIAEHAVQDLGFDSSAIYVATGLNYPDALAAGACVAKTANPILLVKTDEVPQSVVDFIASHSEIIKIRIVGGTGAVSSTVEEVLRNMIQ
jgi:putative cell wall-binding protein